MEGQSQGQRRAETGGDKDRLAGLEEGGTYGVLKIRKESREGSVQPSRNASYSQASE